MKLIGKASILGLTLALASVAACGQKTHSNSQQAPGSSEPAANTGQVGMQLTLPGGVTISQVSYTISGPTPQTGTVPVGDAQSIQFVVGGLAAGSYTIALSASDSAGDPCSGSGTFTIVPGTVTGAVVTMQCIVGSDAVAPAPVNSGSVLVEAGVTLEAGAPTVCPGISSLTVTPAELPVGSTAMVAVATIGGAPTIQWSQTDAPGQTGAGTFGAATAASTTFKCTTAGQAVLTVSVATGACVGVPFTTLSTIVTCDAPADAGAANDASDASDAAEASTTPSPCAQFNGGAGCTPTEQALVAADSNGACYSCLANAGCLDDSLFGDIGNECGDFANPSDVALCMDTLNCLISSNCAAPLSKCYCGSAGVSSTCQGNPAPGPIDGVCAAKIAAGLGFPASDGTDITKNLTDKTKPGGRADQIFQCASSNGCVCP
jgi:hypothetical protein